ncbi:MAG: hypothetical protein LBH77_05195 [Tannerella sp.]|nr:hypothetical protein [Tannerella sp.]
MAKTSKTEVVSLLKERKLEIKSKDYIQSTQFMSSSQADRCVMGIGNYGFTCMKHKIPQRINGDRKHPKSGKFKEYTYIKE